MIAFQIADTKPFMTQLLKGDLFNSFCLRQFDAETFASFQITGERNHSFYTNYTKEAPAEKFCSWEEIRPYAFLLIKGSRLPKAIKIIFSLNQEQTASFTNAAALFLNITFCAGVVTCTTGCSQKIFSMDKSLEQLWDSYILEYFKNNDIATIEY